MRKMHLRVGLAFIGVFLATGVYMAFTFEEGRIDHDVRLMHRSAHVYLLLSALANLALGGYFRWREPGRYRTIQKFGSVFLLLSPLGFLAAFFIEPAPEQLHRPISVISAFLVLLGVIFLTYGQIKLNSALQKSLDNQNKSSSPPANQG